MPTPSRSVVPGVATEAVSNGAQSAHEAVSVSSAQTRSRGATDSASAVISAISR